MSATLLATDMVSYGLLLSGGNINISLGELNEKALNYQQTHFMEFGASRDDFVMSFIWLVDHKIFLNDLNNFYSLTFKVIIPEILKYNNVFFNDESEFWSTEPIEDDCILEWCLGLDRTAYEAKIKTHEAMIDFFGKSTNEKLDLFQIQLFMQTHGIDEQLFIK